VLINFPPVSSLNTAQSEPLYEQNNIAFVLSVIDGPAWTPFYAKKLKIARLTEKLTQVHDMVLEDLLRHLKEACDFIKRGIDSDKGGYLYTVSRVRVGVELWL
jgi:hypothetical protein